MNVVAFQDFVMVPILLQRLLSSFGTLSANFSFLQDASLCWAHLPRFFSTAVRGWTSDRPAVATASTTAMKAVANECIRSHVETFSKDTEKSSTFKTIFGHVEGGLKYQCHTAWAQVTCPISFHHNVGGNTDPGFSLWHY